MSKLLSSILYSATIVPLMWWNVVPNAAQNCNGSLPIPVPYTQHGIKPGTGEAFIYEGIYTQHASLCKMVQDFPAPKNI